MDPLTEKQRQAIQAEIFREQKISAIKLYRNATGAGLKEAKDAVEAIEKELRATEPQKFKAESKKSGCLSVVALGALVSAVTVTIYVLSRS